MKRKRKRRGLVVFCGDMTSVEESLYLRPNRRPLEEDEEDEDDKRRRPSSGGSVTENLIQQMICSR